GFFLLGPEIDSAEPLAVGFELCQPRLDLDERGDRGVRLQRRERKTSFWRAVELFANCMRALGAPLARRFKTRLGAGPIFACSRQALLHLAQGFLQTFQCSLGESEIVRRLAALALGRRDRIEKFGTPLLDLRRQIGERGKIGARLLLAGAERRDLLARIGNALLPQRLLGADRLDALLPEPHLALEPFERRLGSRMNGALLGGR